MPAPWNSMPEFLCCSLVVRRDLTGRIGALPVGRKEYFFGIHKTVEVGRFASLLLGSSSLLEPTCQCLWLSLQKQLCVGAVLDWNQMWRREAKLENHQKRPKRVRESHYRFYCTSVIPRSEAVLDWNQMCRSTKLRNTRKIQKSAWNPLKVLLHLSDSKERSSFGLKSNVPVHQAGKPPGTSKKSAWNPLKVLLHLSDSKERSSFGLKSNVPVHQAGKPPEISKKSAWNPLKVLLHFSESKKGSSFGLKSNVPVHQAGKPPGTSKKSAWNPLKVLLHFSESKKGSSFGLKSNVPVHLAEKPPETCQKRVACGYSRLPSGGSNGGPRERRGGHPLLAVSAG